MADVIRRCADCGWTKVNGECTNPVHADEETEEDREPYIPYAFRALNEMDGYGLKESDFH